RRQGRAAHGKIAALDLRVAAGDVDLLVLLPLDAVIGRYFELLAAGAGRGGRGLLRPGGRQDRCQAEPQRQQNGGETQRRLHCVSPAPGNWSESYSTRRALPVNSMVRPR